MGGARSPVAIAPTGVTAGSPPREFLVFAITLPRRGPVEN